MNLRQAVVFCILMQSNGGILTKAPLYVLEKLNSVSMMNEPEALLDYANLSIFHRYFERWGIPSKQVKDEETCT